MTPLLPLIMNTKDGPMRYKIRYAESTSDPDVNIQQLLGVLSYNLAV